MQTFFLIADDVMDQSDTRRNKPCWYKQVGLSAMNDSILLESLVFLLLKEYFQNRPGGTYVQLFSLFREIIFKTSLGQALDMEGESFDLLKMSFERSGYCF